MPPVTRYTKLSDLPARIPIFPLRGAILLPRATMPLNIFEPRYLAMVDFALAGDRVLGIIQPAKSDPDQESPYGKSSATKPIGCTGRITAFQELEDGRVLISLQGVARFRVIDEEKTPHPFRLVNIAYDEFADDLVAGSGEEDVDREQLLEGLRNYLTVNRLEADWDAISRASSELLVNSLSVISPFGPEEKQALLEAPNLKRRAEILIALAQMELATDDRSGGNLQ